MGLEITVGIEFLLSEAKAIETCGDWKDTI
jgi:hypothetical protein